MSDKSRTQFTRDYLQNIWSPDSLSSGNSIDIVSLESLRKKSHAVTLSDHLDDMRAIQYQNNNNNDNNKNNRNDKFYSSRYQTVPMKDGDTASDEPLYMFHRGLWRNSHLSKNVEKMHTSNDSIRRALQDTCTTRNPYVNQSSSETIEYVFGVGGIGSGTTLHRHGETWLHMIEGTKRIIMYPPTTLPPLQYVVELSQRDWIEQIYELNNKKVYNVRSEECTVRRGDALYIPSAWFHSSINCDETVALALQTVVDPFGATTRPLGTSEIHIENVWRAKIAKHSKISTSLLDALQKRITQIAPRSPILHILWSEANSKLNTAKRLNAGVKLAKVALQHSPNTPSAYLSVAIALAYRVTRRIIKYNVTQKNYQKVVNDMSDMVQKMNKALELDQMVTRKLRRKKNFVATSIFRIFGIMEKILPLLGEHFLLDLGLDIVEERARNILKEVLKEKLQRAIDSEACRWTEVYKWYMYDSPDGKPSTWKYFQDHRKEIKERYMGNTKEAAEENNSYNDDFQSELLPLKYWREAPTVSEQFARELMNLGGGDMSMHTAPINCLHSGHREHVLVKQLVNKANKVARKEGYPE